MSVRGRLLLIALAMVLVSCAKKKISLRDPATLPHVDRGFPGVTSTENLPDNAIVALRSCFDEALARDPKEGGTISLRIDAEARVSATIKDKTSDERFRFCVQSQFENGFGPDFDARKPHAFELTFQSQMRHEATPPGWFAFSEVIRDRFRGDGARVLATRLQAPAFDSFVGEKRVRSATVDIDVEILKNGTYRDCGSISDFSGEPEEAKMPCRVKKHFRGEHATVTGYVSFMLDDDGWNDGRGRHWFGDEPREIVAR